MCYTEIIFTRRISDVLKSLKSTFKEIPLYMLFPRVLPPLAPDNSITVNQIKFALQNSLLSSVVESRES